jgi:hypothetical protein
MTYELARQLSDAGFPFVPIAAAPLTRRGRDFIAFADGPSYHEPSLTELIDECRQFHRLSHEAASDRWYAQGATFIGEGNDPEEAVARLWLQLQQRAA